MSAGKSLTALASNVDIISCLEQLFRQVCLILDGPRGVVIIDAGKQKDGAFATLVSDWVAIGVRSKVDQGEVVAIRSHQAGVLEDFELAVVAPVFQVLGPLGSHLADGLTN